MWPFHASVIAKLKSDCVYSVRDVFVSVEICHFLKPG